MRVTFEKGEVVILTIVVKKEVIEVSSSVVVTDGLVMRLSISDIVIGIS